MILIGKAEGNRKDKCLVASRGHGVWVIELESLDSQSSIGVVLYKCALTILSEIEGFCDKVRIP